MFEVERFGGAGATELHPAIILLMVVAIALVLMAPRKYIVAPLLSPMMLIPLEQAIVIGGLHFQVLRLMLLGGWIRVAMERSNGDYGRKARTLDALIIGWAVAGSIAFCLLWQNTSAVINRFGYLYTILGTYLLLRFLIRTEADICGAVKTLAAVSALIALCMIGEHLTGRNVFAIFGGVPEQSVLRDGKLRAQGPFAHPLLAGTFGATHVALFAGLLWGTGHRKSAILGVLSATVIAGATASSTPLVAYLAALFALCAWPLRNHMSAIRWGVFFVLTALHLSMNAPVWALIGRLDVSGGSSSSFHRYQLVDQFIRRANEWWLIGTKSTSHWGWFLGDTVNQYVEVGVTGGIVALALFIAVISMAFKILGRSRKAYENARRYAFPQWALGAALFSHCIAFMGIAYFDQSQVSWSLLLAMIAAYSSRPGVRTRKARVSDADQIPGPSTEHAFDASTAALASL